MATAIYKMQNHQSRLDRARIWVAATQSSAEEARAAIEQAALEHEPSETRAAIDDVSAGLDVAQTWGHPARDKCRYTKENEVDLLVMGSHGRTGLK
jgi:nucleotide-binding universal stress UspA family protein